MRRESDIAEYIGLLLAAGGGILAFYELQERGYASELVIIGGIASVVGLVVASSGIWRG